MDIGSKAKILFNELIEIPFSLLYLLETPNESKRDYQNNTMKPLTNNLMKPILPIGKKEGLLIDDDYPPRYCSPNDKSEKRLWE